MQAYELFCRQLRTNVNVCVKVGGKFSYSAQGWLFREIYFTFKSNELQFKGEKA
jgi:hypothetical protein